MTTTVRVQARAWGATVETSTGEGETETVQLGAHQDRAFHVEEGKTLTLKVTHGEQPVDRANELMDEEVPGRAQNDQLLGKQQKTKPAADPAAGLTPTA